MPNLKISSSLVNSVISLATYGSRQFGVPHRRPAAGLNRSHKKRPRTLSSPRPCLWILLIVLFGRFCIPRRYCIIRVAYTAAHVHEAAAARVIECTSAPRMIREAGARRNEAAHDDVFLQAAQVILETPNRRLGKHAGGLLERRCRDEGLGRQGCLGDAQQHGFPGRLVLTLGLLLRNDIEQPTAIHLFALEQRRIAGIQYLDLA